MLICSYCGHENLKSSGMCEECNQDLVLQKDKKIKKQDCFLKSKLKIKVKKIEIKTPTILSSESTVKELIDLMQEKKVDSVIICKGKKIVGIVSERDILYKVALKEKEMMSQKVTSIMSEKPECLKGKNSLAYVLNRMSVGGFRHLPITSRSTPVGVISVKDVLDFVCQNHK